MFKLRRLMCVLASHNLKLLKPVTVIDAKHLVLIRPNHHQIEPLTLRELVAKLAQARLHYRHLAVDDFTTLCGRYKNRWPKFWTERELRIIQYTPGKQKTFRSVECATGLLRDPSANEYVGPHDCLVLQFVV